MLKAKFFNATDFDKIKRSFDRKKRTVLTRTGAYARTVMRRSIRKGKTQKGEVTLAVDDEGNSVFIDDRGRVRSEGGRFLRKEEAARARQRIMKSTKTKRGAGKPPRSQTDRLREIFFYVDEKRGEVTIAPLVYKKQPKLFGVKSVPELLEFGGKEELLVGGQKVVGEYVPRPFVLPVAEPASEFMGRVLEETPLK